MNTYYSAILKATSNGAFPEYSDLWRSYHISAYMLDSDYCLFQKNDRTAPTTREEARTGRRESKLLYVPVTRKVSSEIRKNNQDLH